ncbi:MerR family transcriptional regulator [Massilia sp. YMA4]|uniref:MerR family transcriptional regulator n=1 Tax=[Empedobacter] haloabium TaxID=592317 RepID=A0ABZ1URK8_9BURK|nr:MerR family transcriptional regulator [Massilia sp. YMA4]
MSHSNQVAVARGNSAAAAHFQVTADMGINEVTSRAGVSERLVRHCAMRGLLSCPANADVSWLAFTEEDVSILRFIRQAHVLGFGMNESAKLLRQWQALQADSIASGTPDLGRRREPLAPEAPSRIVEALVERLQSSLPVEQQPSCPILEAFTALGGSKAVLAEDAASSCQ